MKVLKEDSDFVQRVEKVFQCMEENGIVTDYIAGEFRLTDTRTNNKRYHNMPLMNFELNESIKQLPPICEYRITIFDSEK